MKSEPANAMRISRDAQRGFTLIELMMAMVIMSVGLFAVVHLQVASIRGHRYSWELSEASWVGLGIVEDLRVRSSQWVNLNRIGPNSLGDALGKNMVYLATSPKPASGENYLVTDLLAVAAYKSSEISSGPLLDDSLPINVWGEPNQPGGIYRAHYVAFSPFLQPTDPFPNNQTVQLYLDITWDAKDHGEGYDWSQWSQPQNYFKRHLYRLPVFMQQTRYF